MDRVAAGGDASPPDRLQARALARETERGRQRLGPGIVVMNQQEFRAASSLAAVFSVRLLGLFMIYPVFAAYAGGLSGANAYLVGEALGIYGLSQGLLQIPFGLLSDRIGRKPMIVAGLLLFAIGSAVAALSTSIGGVIVGRVLQGSGAVGSVILALVADLTREENRTKAMAITEFVVPTPRVVRVHRDAETVPGLIGSVLRNGELLRLNFGVFALHAMLTASFLVVPGLLHTTLGLTSHDQWMVYLPVLVVSLLVTVPAIVIAEKYRRLKGVFVASVGGLLLSQLMLHFGGAQLSWLLAVLVVFFSAFNVMEATLPSLITKVAPPDAKGTATGLYSSAQFIGIFAGGVLGGWAHQHGGVAAVFSVTAGLALLWLLAAGTMKQPTYLSTRLVPIGERAASDAERIAEMLRQVPGVAEAVVIAEEKLAYLK